ncbi:hypothetical protein [Pueribacillus sp. YX66]|uniref:hypothetical protein n=1 Tax=Pueribacillus sp. YX66 TaxID=3229242 RepID=UPI00358D6844
MGSIEKSRNLLREIGQNEEALEKTSLQLKKLDNKFIEIESILQRGKYLIHETSEGWKGERANRYLNQSFINYSELRKQLQSELHEHQERLIEQKSQLRKKGELLQKAYAELKAKEQ